MSQSNEFVHHEMPGMPGRPLCICSETHPKLAKSSEEEVTCPKCLEQLGIEPEPKGVAHAMNNKDGVVVPLCGAKTGENDTVTCGAAVNCPECKRRLGYWEKYLAEEVSKERPVHYYDVGGISTIDVIRAKLTPEQLKGYYLGNIIKYSLRLNHKGNAHADAQKLDEYANWLRESFDADSEER